MFRYARHGDGRSLIGAAILFGLATITRNTGMPFLLLPVGGAARSPAAPLTGLRRAALTGVTAALCDAVGDDLARGARRPISRSAPGAGYRC